MTVPSFRPLFFFSLLTFLFSHAFYTSYFKLHFRLSNFLSHFSLAFSFLILFLFINSTVFISSFITVVLLFNSSLCLFLNTLPSFFLKPFLKLFHSLSPVSIFSKRLSLLLCLCGYIGLLNDYPGHYKVSWFLG